MKFGPVPLDEAEGAILAHSLNTEDLRLRKGRQLGSEDLERLQAAGLNEVIVARLEPGDLSENEAAAAFATGLTVDHIDTTDAFTGRVNLVARAAGLIRVSTESIDAANSVDEAITLATLPDLTRVAPDQLLATLKIIPYGVSGAKVDAALQALGSGAIRLQPFAQGSARLVLTRTEGFKETLLSKGAAAVKARLQSLGWQLTDVVVVPHDAAALAARLKPDLDMTLILAASATSDRGDVTPRAIELAGGTVDRVGMPVDPGNLLVMGKLKEMPVLGLPGCARSPALNGADWVLERLAAGLSISGADIARMGVGGLLKEMPERPHSRLIGRADDQ